MMKITYSDRWKGLVAAAILVALAWLATIAPNPPAPLPADSAAGVFSARRAFAHVQAVAREPHPIGSPANAEVRAYIVKTLNALGIQVEEQNFSVRVRETELRGVNLLARIPGAGKGKGVALVCHHDSVPTSPGASDDGAGVATLLETGRALKSGPPLRNDVFLLFTDGEERGLLGAQAFVRESPHLEQIALVLNFEARGVSGPVYMFETSPGNGRIIKEFAAVVRRPATSSLMYEVYRRMPNDTDFTVFKKAGVAGLNFGFIGEPQHYHQPTDDPAHLSLHSLQHEGDYALALVRRFGEVSLMDLEAPDVVYFDLFGRVLVRYGNQLALVLAGTATALYIIVIVRRGSPLKVGTAAFAFVLYIALAAFVVRWLPLEDWALWYAAILVTLLLHIGVNAVLRRWLTSVECTLGALLPWAILSLASAWWLPGGSFLAAWPLFFALLGLLPRSDSLLWSVISGAPVMILLAPLVKSFYVALGSSAIFVPTIVLGLLLAAVTMQVQGLLGPGRNSRLRNSEMAEDLPITARPK